ncbi:hypothetical protein RFI_14113, partial [Reticulomyxa filosa]
MLFIVGALSLSFLSLVNEGGWFFSSASDAERQRGDLEVQDKPDVLDLQRELEYVQWKYLTSRVARKAKSYNKLAKKEELETHLTETAFFNASRMQSYEDKIAQRRKNSYRSQKVRDRPLLTITPSNADNEYKDWKTVHQMWEQLFVEYI